MRVALGGLVHVSRQALIMVYEERESAGRKADAQPGVQASVELPHRVGSKSLAEMALR